MVPKCTAENVENAIDLVDLEDGWMKKLLDIDKDSLILILCELCNQGCIPNKRLKADRIELSSFSTAKWHQFASSVGLSRTLDDTDFDSFFTPAYQLPPSFHTANFESAWRAQDVYQEKASQTREAARFRILDPYIAPILALFHGRLVDKAEDVFPENEYSTGGDVEHKVFMVGGLLFFVLQIQYQSLPSDNLAQLFLEFLSAATMNSERHNLRIYGLLTNLTRFHFYSYDPIRKKFYVDEKMFLDLSRLPFLSGMIGVSNKIFGVILNAYIEGLQVTIANTTDRVFYEDSSVPGLLLLDQLQTVEKMSTDKWKLALKLALECVDKLNEKVISIEDMEKNSTEALAMLANSVHYIPRASFFTGGVDPKSADELQVMARNVVHNELRSFLTQ